MEDLLQSWFPDAPWLAHLAGPGLAIASIVAVLIVVSLAIRRAIDVAVRQGRLDRTAATFVGAVLRYTLLTIGVIAILSQLGVDTASLMGSVGVVGLTVGFAARDALSNVISGLFILWDRPFVIGDLIEIEGLYGRVDRITMRSTRVVTPDGKMLAIPNTTVVNTTVASYTNFPHLRLDIDVTVGVEEDLGRIRQVLLELCEGEPFHDETPPSVVMTAINDYNVALQLRAWLRDESPHLKARLELRERVFEALREAGVNMPFETLEVRTMAA